MVDLSTLFDRLSSCSRKSHLDTKTANRPGGNSTYFLRLMVVVEARDIRPIGTYMCWAFRVI